MDRAQDRSAHRLALIELVEREGHPARLVDVRAWPVTLGRALDNDIVLDDPHVAAHHAVLEWVAPSDGADDGRIALRVLATRNGVRLDGRAVDDAAPLALPAGGALLQMGATAVRLRLPGEVLAPERPLANHAGDTLTRTLLQGAALQALVCAQHAISLDPGADFSAWLPTLFGLPLVVMAWCGLWALLSKLFQHRFDFTGHLRIALPWLLGFGLLEALWPQVAAALNWPRLWQLTPALEAVGGALLVHAHLRHMLPLRPRAVSASVAGLLLLGLGISLAGSLRANDSPFSTRYMSTLPLPALRLAGTVPAATLVQDMAPLAARLAQRAKKAREEDRDDSNAPVEE
jgi:hypothetical protein